MAVAFGSTGTGLAYGTHTNSAVPVPASVAANDVILAIFHQDVSSSNTLVTITAATGFTAVTFSPALQTTISEQTGLYLFWKRATGADSGTYSFTHTSTSTEAVAIRYTGCVTTGTPLEVLGSALSNTAVSTSPAVSGTTTQTNEMLVYAQNTWGTGAATPPTGFGERYDGASDLEVADKVQASAGATGSVSGTRPSGEGSAFLVGLLAPGSGSSLQPQPYIPNWTPRMRASTW